MPDLRVGLVGPGAIGQTHAAAIAAVPGLVLAAVAGGTPEQLATLPAGVPRFPDAAAMLAGGPLDIVAITTPSGDHFDPARAALARGCHLLVEKPLAVDPGEAARLVALARRAGVVAGTVSQRRLEPQHLDIRAKLASGALGRPRLIEANVHWWRSDDYYREKPWRGEIAHGGGSLVNQGIHSLDLMMWLLGPVHAVTAQTATLGHALPVEDTTAAVLTFASGAIGTLLTSTATPPGRPAGLRLFTDRGSFELAQDQTVRWDFADVPPPPAASGIASGAANPAAIGIQGHVDQWQDFLAAIRDGRPPAVTLQDGCDAVRVAAAIYRAAAEGRSVAVAEFPGEIDG
jgi:predicted dehydrogenase